MKLLSKIATGISIFAICITVGNVSAGASVLAKTPRGNAAPTATQTTEPPETPGNFRLEKRTGNQLRLNWDWVAGGVGAIHYEIAYAGKTVIIDHYYPGHTQDVSDIDLTPGHTYIFKLWAVDEVGNRSAVPAQLVFETTPPTPPSNLQLMGMRGNYPDIISFNLSTDNAGQIRNYEAILNGKSLGTIPLAQGTSTFSLLNQIFVQACRNAPHGSATLQIRAYDTSFNPSQLSTPLTVVFP